MPQFINTKFWPKALLLVFCFGKSICPAQELKTAYQHVDEKILAYPKQKNTSIDSLVAFVKNTFYSDAERVRAYYTWISQNIVYDMELLDHYKLSSGLGLRVLPSLRTQHADTVFKYRKAVCEGICRLMNSCCEKSGINSIMICGITRLENQIDEKILHTWNAVLIDSVWRLVDITWSGGFINQSGQYVHKFSDKYFFSDPTGFVDDHWPLDPMWQLLNYPVAKKNFMENNMASGPVFYNYRDSIRAYFSLNKSERDYADLQHYHAADPGNKNYKESIDFYVFNKAVTVFNLASLYFEDYITYATKLEGKPITKKNTLECIRLLLEPKKLLQEGLKYSKGRVFFNQDVLARFNDMVSESELRLKDVNSLLDSYYKLLRSY